MTATPNDLQRTPILPGEGADIARRQQSRLRRRMLESAWMEDLIDAVQQHFDPVTRQTLGKPDMSRNDFRRMVHSLSALYPEPPAMHAPDGTSEEAIEEAEAALLPWWHRAPRNQRFTVGLRDSFAMPVWSPRLGRVLYRLVTADMVHATSPPDDPEQPDFLVEAQLREYEGRTVWTWDQVDLRDVGDPRFAILLPEQQRYKGIRDVTDYYFPGLGGFSGERYPWRDLDGQPVMPYVAYHAEDTGSLFDAWELREAVEGALRVAVYWTYWGYGVKAASWIQRYMVNAYLRGTASKGEDYSNHHAVALSPATVAQIRSDGNDPAQIGQWSPPFSPKEIGEGIHSYQMALAEHFGLGPDDFQRSGSAESGYAISLKTTARREAQRAYKPTFSASDSLMIRNALIVYNHNSGKPAVTEEGWKVTYRGLPRTPAETSAALDELERLMAMDPPQASPVDVYIARHPEVSREQAEEALYKMRDETNRLRSGTRPLPIPEA